MKINYSYFILEEGIICYKAGKIKQSLQYWYEAASLGNVSAMFNIGIHFLQKASSQQELLIAKTWFEKAAKAGHKNANIQIEKIDILFKNKEYFSTNTSTYNYKEKIIPYNKIAFGNYDWLILEQTEKELLCLSEYLISIRRYHETYECISWEKSSIRQWLNTDFLNMFQKSEQILISEKTILNQGNSVYNISETYETIDKIFLLSIQEVQQYLSLEHLQTQENDLTKIHSDDFLRKAYLKLDDKQIFETYEQYGHDYSQINGQALGWWLRTPGSSTCRAMRINCNGTIRHYGREVNRNLVGIRPAMWIRKV